MSDVNHADRPHYVPGGEECGNDDKVMFEAVGV